MTATNTMTSTNTEPIVHNWTSADPQLDATGPVTNTATAVEVNELLARLEVVDIDAALVPHLAAAAAELALVAGIAWRFSVDDAPVALLRLIAKVALVAPESAGVHAHRLQEILTVRTAP